MKSRVRFLMPSLVMAAAAVADPIAIPNFSFELPPVVRDQANPFGALPFIDNWDEKAVGPADEFDQDTGNFINTDVGEPDHITNLHLDRAAFLSSLISNAIRQELPQLYLPGHSYTFTVSVGKSHSFPVGNTEQLQVALFYFNGSSEQIIASTLVSGNQVGTTVLADVTVSVPVVSATDAWAGEQIGVLIQPSTADPNDGDGEGYWNVDHARLDISPPIPAVSTWGLVVLGMVLLTAGTLALARKGESFHARLGAWE